MHPFDQALQLTSGESGESGESGRCIGQPHPAWANFIGPFGGMTAAQMLQAVMQHPERLGEPTALTVNFCAAVADAPFAISAQPVRTNRSTQHWVVTLSQSDEVVITATAVTAVRRPTWSGQDADLPSDLTPPEQTEPANRGHTPAMAWLKQYESRPLVGYFPPVWDGTQTPHSLTRMWVRHSEPRKLDALGLTAMSDVFFPRIFLRRATAVPAGTVSMTVYFHADAEELAAVGNDYVLCQAQGQRYQSGFFDQTGLLWSPAGALLASTHQIVYFKS